MLVCYKLEGVHCPWVTVQLKLYLNVGIEYGLVCVVHLHYWRHIVLAAIQTKYLLETPCLVWFVWKDAADL